MKKSKLYIRTLSTILSVLTIFSGIYNSYGVKAGKTEDGTEAGNTEGRTNAEAGNPENGTDKDKQAALLALRSSSSQALTTTRSQLALTTSSKEQAIATTSDSQDVVTEELYKQANEIIECHSEWLVKLWTKCLEHLKNILSFCEKENGHKHLSEQEKETLSIAFDFIISNNTIFPLPEGAVAKVGFLGGIGLNVSDELVTAYESLYKICFSAKGKSSSGTFSSGISVFSLLRGKGNPEPDNNAAFVQNAYKVFRERMGQSATDNNSIWYLTSRLQTLLSSRILLLRDYGLRAINPMAAQFLACLQPVVDMASVPLSNLIGEFCRGLTGAFNNSFQAAGNCLAGGGVEAITKPFADVAEGALKNAATTSLDYAKITALQTGAGLAGIFVTAKLVCNLIPKILSDSNNRNKQKQAVAENREQPHKVENQ